MEEREEKKDLGPDTGEKMENPGADETIDIESIMDEIRAEIKRKGYKEKEVRFEDINISYADDLNVDDLEFSMDVYKKQLLLLNIQKSVNTNKPLYADSRAGKLEIFFKKAFRKCARFYVEPLVSGQNEYNETNAMLLCQLYAALKRVEELETKVDRLENMVEQLSGRPSETDNEGARQ